MSRSTSSLEMSTTPSSEKHYETTQESVSKPFEPMIPPPKRSISSALRLRVLRLTPGFWASTMGTGISSILLYRLPYQPVTSSGHYPLQIIGTIIFVINILLFLVLLTMNLLRYLIWPRIFKETCTHPAVSWLWGMLPMGFATIVNMIAYACVPVWGEPFARLARGLWWIDVALSILCGFAVPFIMFFVHKQTTESISAIWLQPIVAAVVAAASGGVVASVLEPEAARTTVLASYFIWGCGVPLAFLIMAIYFYRLCVLGLPSGPATPSIWLPLGPCGQGAFGIIQLGRVTRTLAYEYGIGLSKTLPAGVEAGSAEALVMVKGMADSVYAGGLVLGSIMWGVGLFWMVIACSTVINQWCRGRFPFTIGCWAFTFPLGVWSVATTTLAEEFDSFALRVIGTFTSLWVVIAWLIVGGMTAWKSMDGSVFVAPELAQWKGEAPPRKVVAKHRDSEVTAVSA